MNEKIVNIFKRELKSDKGSDMDLKALVSDRMKTRINYNPYYQRNYVWQEDKATALIESLMLGYQIPPIILFERVTKENRKILEIIDGRQRYETLMRFLENDFALNLKGLQVYKNLEKKKFDQLPIDIQNRLNSSKISLVKYSLSYNIDENSVDYVIKEIFRRYNSGITKMKSIDNERAEYIENDLIKSFEKYIKSNIEDYTNKFSILFFSEKKQNNLQENNRDSIEELKKVFRKLYVIHLCPIKKYLSKPSLLKSIFDSLEIENNVEEIISNFNSKIILIYNVVYELLEKDYFYKINKELAVVFYWLLSIMEQEEVDLNLVIQYKHLFIKNIDEKKEFFYISDINYMHKPYKFELFLTILTDILKHKNIELMNDLNEIYIKSKESLNFGLNTAQSNLEKPIRVHKEEAHIESFLEHIKNGKYLVRPSYQRNEVINNVKSSGIIESILLDIKLPPIFVYEGKNGISEVIDGQQRILSILGFLNQKYQNETGQLEETKKQKFKLSGLKILSDLNGKNFQDLTQEQQDSIWDNSLTIIKISEEDNPDFDPINLFLRLNLKPYPIDENSFEMWNSYLDKEITDLIKVNSNNSYFKDIYHWAYFKRNDKRMENEEIYTILAHIDYYKNSLSLLDILDIHIKNEKIVIRLQSKFGKQNVTKALKDIVNYNEIEKEKFKKSLKNIQKMFKKIEALLISIDENINTLGKSLDKITQNKGLTRKKYTFYLFYVLLSNVNQNIIIEHREKNMLNDIKEFFEILINNIHSTSNTEEYKSKIQNFIDIYTPHKRKITLTEKEKTIKLKQQNNLCPLCNNKIIASSDEIHIDHIIPLSKGGKDENNNLQIVHSVCNLKKGSKS